MENSVAVVLPIRACSSRLLPLSQGGVQKSAGSGPCFPRPDVSHSPPQAPSMFSLCSFLSVSFNSSKHFHLYGSNASLAQVGLWLLRSPGNRNGGWWRALQSPGGRSWRSYSQKPEGPRPTARLVPEERASRQSERLVLARAKEGGALGSPSPPVGRQSGYEVTRLKRCVRQRSV